MIKKILMIRIIPFQITFYIQEVSVKTWTWVSVKWNQHLFIPTLHNHTYYMFKLVHVIGFWVIRGKLKVITFGKLSKIENVF